MTVILKKYFERFRHIYFNDAMAFIYWLKHNLSSTVLMSLDHDLGSKAEYGGCGTDVVNYLGTREPSCSVIVHSANVVAGPHMEAKLLSFGWDAVQVNLLQNEGWIRWRMAISHKLPIT